MKQFAIIGIGRFGRSVAKTLAKMGHDVLVIDSDEERIEEILEFVTHGVVVDALDEHALMELGLRNFDTVIVAIGQDIQASILVTVLLKECGCKYVVAKAMNELHGRVLERTGADRVIYPERDMGVRVAHNLVANNVLEYIELSPDYSIMEVVAAPRFVGKNLRETGIGAMYGINIMAIKRGKDIFVAPHAEEIIQKGDVLLAVGSNDSLKNIEVE